MRWLHEQVVKFSLDLPVTLVHPFVDQKPPDDNLKIIMMKKRNMKWLYLLTITQYSYVPFRTLTTFLEPLSFRMNV